MNDLKVGQVVRPIAGRDKGQTMVVYEILDQSYVTVCDGKLRKVSNPKKKKIRHLAKTNQIVTKLHDKLKNGDKVSNAEVRKCLEVYTDDTDDSKSEEV